ncbi:MAG: dihydrodipicolinate synthase family protein [Chloroflexi bacterium]|nr:dihydrodipicolinate synthase family protein [Chloroflexota bacterium]
MKKEIRGVLPPIPTPFDADGNVAETHLRANLARWVAAGLHGFVVLGSNGEYTLLSKEEKLRVLAIAREMIPPDRWLIAGTGADSTREAIDLTQRAAERGADAALVVTPHYYRAQMNATTWTHHYRALADASPIPIMIYNVPAFTTLDVDAAMVIELSRHENIVGIKDSSANFGKMGEIIRFAPPEFAVLVGTGAAIFPALSIGAKGVVPALGNIAPRECVAIYDAFHAGALTAARQLQLRLIRPNRAVTATWGVPGLKAALDELGYYGGPPRSPLLPLDESDRSKLREILREAELL